LYKETNKRRHTFANFLERTGQRSRSRSRNRNGNGNGNRKRKGRGVETYQRNSVDGKDVVIGGEGGISYGYGGG
jgi:hypothetical protein